MVDCVNLWATTYTTGGFLAFPLPSVPVNYELGTEAGVRPSQTQALNGTKGRKAGRPSAPPRAA